MGRWRSYLGSVLALALVAALLAPAATSGWNARRPSHTGAHASTVTVIVRMTAGSGDAAERYVARVGGRVTTTLGMLNAFVAEIPASAASGLESQQGVASVRQDADMTTSYDHARDFGSVADGWTSSASATSKNVYLDTIRAKSVWSLDHSTTGNGVTVAVIDTGISVHQDFGGSSRYNPNRIEANTSLVDSDTTTKDANGHGTLVAGLIAGDGAASSGKFSGVAPGCDVLNVRAGDSDGRATEADVLDALQWVYDHRTTYNIRVVNVSLNACNPASYQQSAIDAACEILWFNGIVVVTSAGNTGPSGDTIRSAPANDPFVITVGATDDKGTESASDDSVASFSAYGTTTDGFRKPDIYAPGRNIFSTLSKDSPWAAQYPDRLDSTKKYFRLSGTSVSAPVVAGAVALLLQDEPNLTPDQVKYRLISQSSRIVDASGTPTPYLDAYRTVTGRTTTSANTGLMMSTLLTTGTSPVLGDSVMWRSVMWRSVLWDSVMWRSVLLNSVMWRSDNDASHASGGTGS